MKYMVHICRFVLSISYDEISHHIVLYCNLESPSRMAGAGAACCCCCALTALRYVSAKSPEERSVSMCFASISITRARNGAGRDSLQNKLTMLTTKNWRWCGTIAKLIICVGRNTALIKKTTIRGVKA
jgi:hypothetical protein